MYTRLGLHCGTPSRIAPPTSLVCFPSSFLWKRRAFSSTSQRNNSSSNNNNNSGSSRLNTNSHRIVIPRLPSAPGPTAGPSSAGARQREPSAREIPAHVGLLLDHEGAASLQRQQQLHHFRREVDQQVDRVWRNSRGHLRKQQKLIDEYGVEGAMREMLSARAVDGSAADRGHHHTRRSLSFREQLRQRPIDKKILEEIYTNLHGKRIERKLKKGVSWEHWITKGDGTAPVFETSRKGQQTFAFGGHITLVKAAAHASQFPTVYLNSPSPASAPPGGRNPKTKKPRPHQHQPQPQPPQPQIPEVAFIGRTNSGKSSLINALVNATITPYGHLQGTTAQVRFYNVANKVMLVDCPGYGYYHPMGQPAVDAANAVRAMRRYLRLAGRRRVRATEGEEEGEEIEVRTGRDSETPTQTSATPTTPAAAAKEKDPHLFLDPPSASAAEDEEAEKLSLLQGEEEKEQNHKRTHKKKGGKHAQQEQEGTKKTLSSPPQRRPVKRVFVCVSAHGMQHIDFAYCQLLDDLHIPFSVVITKTDEAPIRYLARLTDYTRGELLRYKQCKELLLVSALRLAGVQQIQSLIGDLAALEGGKGPAVSGDFSSIV